jgi:transporter family protein
VVALSAPVRRLRGLDGHLLQGGLEGIDSDYATLIRTVVIVLTLRVLGYATGKWRSPSRDSGQVGRVSCAVRQVAVFAVLFLGERPHAREWDGIALVAGGVLLLSLRR